MKNYLFQTRRVAFGLAAMAMSTVTIGALVVLPARMESESRFDNIVVASQASMGACTAAQPSESD
jgi:hypothetical protein